jgi:FkbM family methyltransferase
MIDKSIKKILINFNIRILNLIGFKNYFKYLFFFFFNINKIFINKNLDSLNKIFYSLKINYKKNFFFINISKIDDISGEKNCFGLIREIFFKNIYLSKFKFEDPKKINCIDLGANIGIFSLIAAKIFNKVFSVEPQSKYISCYQKLMNDNNVYNALFLNSYVSDLNNLFNTNEKTNFLDIRQLIDSKKLNNIFLKIDIEGAEFKLFEKINFENINAISMEVHQKNGNINDILNSLIDYDYNFLLTDELGDIVKNDLNLVSYIFCVKKNSGISLKE